MPTISSRPNTNRSRFAVAALAAVLLVLFLSANGVARFYTDWLWFDRLGRGGVWWAIVRTKLLLGVGFTVAFFLLFWGNLVLAERLRPIARPLSDEDDLVERYHQVIGSQGARVRLGIAALFALVAGGNTSAQWESWLLFRNSQSFNWSDPLFGRDAGFYVFQLPFISFFVGWLFAALVLTLVVVLIAHYLNGGIRAAAPGERTAPGVKLQVSVLLALLALLRALAYWLDRFTLVRSSRGDYNGALATDVIIQEPAYNLLALISLACAAIFVFNIRRPGWGLPLIAIGIWLASHFAAGSVLPMVYQRLRVLPDQSQREAPYVAHNIEATRFAYGLDKDSVTTVQVDYEPGLGQSEVAAHRGVFSNVPVVDPDLAYEEVNKSEGERKNYSFSSPLDVDRYQIDGELRPVVLSGRGLNVDEIGSSWEQQHVIFTHGYGLAMAAAYDDGVPLAASESRELDFLVSGLGETSVYEGLSAELAEPRIYYGDNFPGYAIVDAERAEVDYQDDDVSVQFRYGGDGGVPMGSFLRRVAFALRFRQLDPLVSRNITEDSRVIYNRDVKDRVREIAPFLRFDQDPYPVISDGSIAWVLDGYTTSNSFPYAQSVREGPSGSDLAGGYNYVRDSVKIVVDAYSGAVTLYAIDEADPVLAAWRSIFPGLFTDAAELPAEISAHLKYPQDLFVVQTEMWSTYQVDDATDLIDGALAWQIATQPSTEAQGSEGADPGPATPMAPQYLMARVPGSDEAEFVLQRAFVPRGDGNESARPELRAIMMARSEPEHYGELALVRLSGQPNAPDRVHAEIRKNDDLTQFIKEKAGAQVHFGEMSILLVDETIVYLRPVYVEANSDTAVPELQRVLAVNGDRIFMASSVEDAVEGIVTKFDGPPGAGDDDDGNGGESGAPASTYSTEGKSIVSLLAEADELLAAADEVDESNPQQAEQLRGQAQMALRAAQGLLGGFIDAPAGQKTDT